MRNRAPCASTLLNSSASTPFFSVAPLVAARRSNVSPTSDSVMVRSTGGKMSATASPRSAYFGYTSQSSSCVRPVASTTASAIVDQPTPVTRWSRRGKGEPEKNTTARSSEASSSVSR
jgi:hypothetical protein